MSVLMAVPGGSAGPSHILAGLSPPLLVTSESELLPLLGELANDPLAAWRNDILPWEAAISPRQAQQDVPVPLSAPAVSPDLKHGAGEGPGGPSRPPTRKRRERAVEEESKRLNWYNQQKQQVLHLEEEVCLRHVGTNTIF
jgi:hypothetical protein